MPLPRRARGSRSGRPRAAPRCTGASARCRAASSSAISTDLAEVHDHHPVGDVPDDVEVVRDEDVGEPELRLQVLEQVQDLRLDRHVERGHRLVADDQLRVDGERARDADPLPLAAGELVREAVVVLGVEPDDLEQLLDAALALRVAVPMPCTSSGSATMKPTRLRGLSEAYGSWKTIIMLAPDRPHLRAGEPGDVAAVEDDRAGGRLEQPHDAAGERRLAAARLADDAERLALAHGEARRRRPPSRAPTSLLQDDPARDREVLLQVLDDEQLVHAAVRLGSRPSPVEPLMRGGRLVMARPAQTPPGLGAGLLVEQAPVLMRRDRRQSLERGQPRSGSGPSRTRSAGWNAQPGGGRRSDGGCPGSAASRSASTLSRGSEPSRPHV